MNNFKLSKLNPKQVFELSKVHIDVYQRLLCSGQPFIRKEDCRYYLDTWMETQLRAANSLGQGVAMDLTKEGKKEIQDLLDSGDYDELLALHENYVSEKPDTEALNISADRSMGGMRILGKR